jgi:hypothetical protein
MSTSLPSSARVGTRTAGALYITASVGFLIVFSWLAKQFDYPDVLDRAAGEVLPRLLTLGTPGRLVWLAYALLPLLLIPAVMGGATRLRSPSATTSGLVRATVVLQSLAALAMLTGLIRWSTLQWSLAELWMHADVAQQATLAATFDARNLLLGNVIGEFAGEALLYGSFATTAWAMRAVGATRMAGFAGITAAVGLVGMWRNVTPAVQPATDIANLLLPAFLIGYGVWLIRPGRHR